MLRVQATTRFYTFSVLKTLSPLKGGLLLDKFKKFKLTTLITYIFSLVFMVLFTYMVDYENLQLDFFFIGALGKFYLKKHFKNL